MMDIPYLQDEMNADRRHIHRRPEEGWTEFETTWFIVERLRAFGFCPSLGLSNIAEDYVLGRDAAKVEEAQCRAYEYGVPKSFLRETEGYTGAVVTIDTGRPGPVTVLRFDIDCVCVEESKAPEHTPAREGFRSERSGLMHACGHDAHTAVGLGVAKWLSRHAEELGGTIRLIFQPAEEGTRGAYAMCAKGLVDDANYFITSHIGGGAPLGELRVVKSGMFATSKINVDFTGVPSHAGANPEKGRSALLAAVAATSMIEGITRHSGGDSRISIGVLRAGEARNVTPVHAHLELETRGLTTEVNEYLEENVRRMVKGAADAYDVTSEVTLTGKALTVPYCSAMAERAEKVARQIPGVHTVCEQTEPSASEDSTIFMSRVVERGGEALMFIFGSHNNGHHRTDFDLEPEALQIGFEMFVRMLIDLNGRK